MKTQPRAPSPTRSRATKTHRPTAPSGLQNPEMLSLRFQTFEDLTTLRRHCMEEMASARKSVCRYRTFLLRPDQPGLRYWRQILKRVTRCWCVLDDLVRINRLDATHSQEVYRALLGIQVAWPCTKGPVHFCPLIAQTIDHVRQLLIQLAQWQHHRG